MKKYRIRPVTLARRRADKGQMTYLRGYGETIWRPYILWIIEGAECNIIVDSAICAADYKLFREEFADAPIEHLMSFEEGLATSGLASDDVDIVVQTHLHFDHCYNTAKCKNARVVVQEEEIRYAANPSPIFKAMYDSRLLRGIDFRMISGKTTIVPGIEVIPVPGHTPGCQAVSIETSQGRAVISGFCSIKENFFPSGNNKGAAASNDNASVIVPGIHYDTDLAYQSITAIKEMADIVLPVHEPDMMSIVSIP